MSGVFFRCAVCGADTATAGVWCDDIMRCPGCHEADARPVEQLDLFPGART